MSRSYDEPEFAIEEAEGLQRRRIDDSMRRTDGSDACNSVLGWKEEHLHRWLI